MRLLSEVVKLAEQKRLVKLLYRRPQETNPSPRVVEPYQLVEEDCHLPLRCWQVEPSPVSGSGWRLLRVDRIVAAEDAGAAFEPRCVVTLSRSMLEALEIDAAP